MNIVFGDYAKSIGGVEVFIIDMIHFLCKNNHKVFFLTETKSDNVYFNYLDIETPNLKFLNIRIPVNMGLYSKKQLALDREKIYEIIEICEPIYVISTYFNTFQFFMDIFIKHNSSKFLFIWPHPLDWIWTVPFIPKDNFITKKIKNRKYFYQRKLFELMSDNCAHYYSCRAVFDFNKWYYDLAVTPPDFIEALPIRADIQKLPQYQEERGNKKIKILWVGRFAFFKNDAIIHIFATLEKLAIQYPQYEIIFNIAGYGPENHTRYIKKNIRPQNITVNYLGGIHPDKLNTFFLQNHIGIAMGLTVKQMAQAGLPAILIDTLQKGYEDKKNCNWIFDTTEGDAGDGNYYDLMGRPLKYREYLEDLLNDVFKNLDKLQIYSIKSKAYVEKYYSFEIQSRNIIKAIENSTFTGRTYHVFRYNFLLRLLYKYYKALQRHRREKDDKLQ